MIHWTYAALRPCAGVIGEFVWGEAAWGATVTLRRLRVIRLTIIILCVTCSSLVCWALVERVLASGRPDSYSYYEGKVLEERLSEMKHKVDQQSDDIRRLLEMANTATLLAVRMQGQMEKQQDMLDSGFKVIGALIVTPVLAILWSIFKTGLRRERPTLSHHLEAKGRRDTNSVLHGDEGQ